MIHAHPIHRDQAETGSAGAVRTLARQYGGQRCCQSASDHHEFKPGQLPSLLTGGRSRRGGCAARRQPGAQAGIIRAAYDPAIRPTRLNEIAELRRVGISGADQRAAAHNLNRGLQLAVQAISAEPPRIHLPSSLSKSSLRPDHHGRSEKGWCYQIQVMRYPK